MKKVLSLVLAAVMLMGIITLSGCGAKDSNTIRIGGIGPLTGGAAAYGNAVKNGAEIALEEINALDELSFDFEFKFEDDEHSPEKADNAYNALRDWEMHILLGTVTTTPCLAVAPKTFAERVFTITPSASSPEVIEGKDNVFQVCFSDPGQGTASAKYIAENAMATKIAVIYKNDDAYSTGIYEAFKAEAERLDLEIVSTTTFTTDTASDFSVQIGDAKANGAELVFLPIYYEPASLILSQAKSADYAPVFFGVDGMDGILSLKGFDKSLAEGVHLLTPFSADSEDAKIKSFVTKYQEKHGEIPNQFAADAYDAMYAIYEAVKKSGVTPDMSAEDMCDKLSEAMTQIQINGLTGAGSALTWNEKGEVSKAPMAVVIKDGVYVGK
ncbi:MAG: ABC transporter substrate-binding protein [Clostridia bacterium]|nr:ABC transporter substrate-binding protein [Clostridia bacterium]